MLSSFGKELRKLRIERDEIMEDMAQKLSVSIAFLSAVENGKREIPQEWINCLIVSYNLDSVYAEKLTHAAAESIRTLKINLTNASPAQRKMAAVFVHSFKDLDENDIQAIMKICKK